MHEIQKTVERERAILVGLNCRDGGEISTDSTMDELEALLETAQGDAVVRIVQNKTAPDSATFIGEGKVQEIKQLCEMHEVDLVIFDNELSPSQTRCLERDLGVRVIDRSMLILDIFADRARTHEGRVQVEMAQYKYILPRLSGLGLSLSRQGGGGVGVRGSRGGGETKLETDRRHIRRRIEKLSSELKGIRHIRELARDRREKNETPIVSLVGYTNAGKSTLFNTLTDENIPARNRLFDTLDTTARAIEVDGALTVMLTDTVGFIRKLPHHLVEAFRATLDELKYADLLLHVIDASNPEWTEQAEVVDALIDELGAGDTPRLRVFNKMDVIMGEYPHALTGGASTRDGVAVSAKTGLGLDGLKQKITELIDTGIRETEFLLPYNDAGALDLLHREGDVKGIDYREDGIAVSAKCDRRVYGRVKQYESIT
jgi:GTP-binding protein HflX